MERRRDDAAVFFVWKTEIHRSQNVICENAITIWLFGLQAWVVQIHSLASYCGFSDSAMKLINCRWKLKMTNFCRYSAKWCWSGNPVCFFFSNWHPFFICSSSLPIRAQWGQLCWNSVKGTVEAIFTTCNSNSESLFFFCQFSIISNSQKIIAKFEKVSFFA